MTYTKKVPDVMAPVSPNEQARLLAILKQHKKKLLRFSGVHYVDVGYAYKRGQPTKTLAIRVHVHEKKPEAALARAQILPKAIRGVPVDVIQSNPEPELVVRTAKQTPLLSGVEITNTRLGITGTLGGIVFDRDTLNPMGLTNHHVLFAKTGRGGDPVNQPAAMGASFRVGTLDRGFGGVLDCAVFQLDGRRTFSLAIADLSNPSMVTATGVAMVGMRVVKSGRTTLVTFGIIDGVDDVFNFTVVPDPTRMPRGSEITAPGDSGSLWLNAQSHAAVGLHYAGEASGDPDEERAWAKKIGGVLEKLGVFFFDTKAMATPFIGLQCRVLGRTRPNAPCHLQIIYPSGRVSTAKGLGKKTARSDGWVLWTWRVGTSTTRRDPANGVARVTLDGVLHAIPFRPKMPKVLRP